MSYESEREDKFNHVRYNICLQGQKETFFYYTNVFI